MGQEWNFVTSNLKWFLHRRVQLSPREPGADTSPYWYQCDLWNSAPLAILKLEMGVWFIPVWCCRVRNEGGGSDWTSFQLESCFSFLSENIFSAVFRDAPLQQDFVLMNICHSPHLTLSPWTLKARSCIETNGGNQWIVDDSASIILLFQDKYPETVRSLLLFLFDYGLTFVFPRQTAGFYCNCSKKTCIPQGKVHLSSSNCWCFIVLWLLRDFHSCNSNIELYFFHG